MSTSPAPHRNDFDQLFRMLVPSARKMLEAGDGRFLPIGATLDETGQMHAVAGMGTNPGPILERMAGDFRAASSALAACGTAYDATLERGTTRSGAIAVWLEHVTGESVIIYVPYQRIEPHVFEYGNLVATNCPPRIWMEDAVSRSRAQQLTRPPGTPRP